MSKSVFIARSVFVVLFIGLIVFLFRSQQISLGDLLSLDPLGVASWFVLMLISWWVSSEKLRLLLREVGEDLSGFELFQLSMATSLFNYLPLQAGTAARGAYLKRRLKLPPATFVSITASTYLIMIFTQSALGFLLCLTHQNFPKLRLIALLFLLGLFTSLFFMVFELPPRLRKTLAGSRLAFLERVHSEFLALSRRPRTIAMLALWELAFLLTEALKIQTAFSLLGSGIPAASVPTINGSLVMAALSIPTVLLNLTPAGIGIRESAITLVALAYGFRVRYAFLAAGLERLLTVIAVFTFGGLSAWRLSGHFARAKKP